MIGIVGEIFLLIAFVFNGIGVFVRSPPKNLALFVFASMLMAFGLFITAHATDQFELLNVYLHSHTHKPLLYKIAGAWASHEGSFLLWCFLLSGYHVFFDLLFCEKNPSPPLQHSAVFLGALQCSFLLFLILACNPFDRLVEIPLEGQDLNPLLQDISLVIHPPHLYLGALGFVIPFVVSLSILLNESFTPFSMRILRLFLVMAQTFLTLGIVLGCAWAYYELGWGGWWFFDPVENLALMPWLFGLIALHMTLVTQKTGKYSKLSLLLSLLPFLQALMGLACVRSGLLNSVHAFGQDPLRSIILWIIFVIWTSVGMMVFIKKKNAFPQFATIGVSLRTKIILGSSLLIFFSWISLFLGTISPVIVSFFGSSIVLDNGFYVWTFIPLLGGALLLIPLTPMATWKTRAHAVFFYTRRNLKQSFPHILSHSGAMISVLGIALSFFYGIEINQTMHKGETYQDKNQRLQLQQILHKDGPNYHGIQGIFHLTTSYANKKIMAEERIFWTQKDQQSKSKKEGTRHVEAGLFTYDILSQGLIMFATTDESDVFTVRIILKPFINLMWGGFFIVILGLSLSTLARIKKTAQSKKHPVL